jgi:hypothetical protein
MTSHFQNNKERLNIMFHDDWEIFGDGSGNPEKLMFDPARRNLDICDKFGAKYTFFAEFGQQLAMLDSSQSTHKKWAAKWEEILKDAIKRGHDVQLHYHPQWIGAQFIHGEWKLDFSKWALSSLGADEIYSRLKTGYDYLSNLLYPVDNQFKLLAFRAGSWMNQPGANIYKALHRLGIKADVTIRAGAIKDFGDIGKIDHSYAPSEILPWFADEEDFARESKSKREILSIPTYSELINEKIPVYFLKTRPFSLVYYAQIKIKQLNLPKIKSPVPKKLSKGNLFHCNFGQYYYMNLIDMVNHAITKCEKENKYNVPFIMLAHSKNFLSHSNFENLLKYLKNYPKIKFVSTRQQLIEMFNANELPFDHPDNLLIENH